MEEEVESLGPPPNGYLYGLKVGEMEENAKDQDGGDKAPSILILKFNKRHVLIHFST